jgi:hypothetical protein
MIRQLLLAFLVLAPRLLAGQTPWVVTSPKVEHSSAFRNPALTESSGVVVSRTQPGVLWSFNDSGNAPEIFATDMAGNDLGKFTVPYSWNKDWEAMATGPCGPRSCLYIGDIGDNKEDRESVTIYQLPEPKVPRKLTSAPLVTERPAGIELRYPDGPHDIEAMYFADSSLYLITKGRSKGVLLFRVPAIPWRNGKAVMAEPLGSLPIVAKKHMGRLVTDAAIAPNGHTVVVRTYVDLYFFERKPNGRLIPRRGTNACAIGGLEAQGEGVDWLGPGRLVLTSESSFLPAGTVIVLRCPGAT